MNDQLNYNSNLNGLPVYQPGRPIEEVARELGLDAQDIVKLASNENPLGPSPKAIQAMREVVDQLHLYPDGNAFYLKRELARLHGLPEDQILLGNGSNEIIEFVGHTLISPGSEVVFSQYAFAIYPLVTHLFGGVPVEVEAKNYGHDLPAMLSRVTEKTRVMFVANPNNPTGTLASRGDVIQLVNEIPDHVLLVIDEAYFEFLDDPIDLLPLIRGEGKPNLLVMRTFSKIFGLAGLRLGYGLGSRSLISTMEKVRQPFNINAIAQAGALAALSDQEHLERTRMNNKGGLEFFQNAFRKLNVRYVKSFANFILAHVGDGNQVFGELQKRGVIVRAMGGYGLGEWIRISIGTPNENSKCLGALREILGK